jgi:hypothetical protein
MQAVEFYENNFSTLESGFSPAQMRALRRKAMRIHAGARSSTEILNALAARVERNPAAVLRDATPAELH